MLYLISNPSDPYTLKADEFKHAVAAVLLLGKGMYGLKPEHGDQGVPIFLLGGCEEWLTAHGMSFDGMFAIDQLAKIIPVLQSVMIGGFAARRDIESALARMTPEDRESYLAERHDRQRSSMNNIGGAALEIVANIRKTLEAALVGEDT